MSNYCRFSYKKSLLSYIWSCLFFQNQTASRSDRAAFLVPISLCEWSDFPWPHAENRHYILYYVFPLMFLETGECDELVSYKGVLWIWYGHDNPYHMPFRKHFIGGAGGKLEFVRHCCEWEEQGCVWPVTEPVRSYFKLPLLFLSNTKTVGFINVPCPHAQAWFWYMWNKKLGILWSLQLHIWVCISFPV